MNITFDQGNGDQICICDLSDEDSNYENNGIMDRLDKFGLTLYRWKCWNL